MAHVLSSPSPTVSTLTGQLNFSLAFVGYLTFSTGRALEPSALGLRDPRTPRVPRGVSRPRVAVGPETVPVPGTGGQTRGGGGWAGIALAVPSGRPSHGARAAVTHFGKPYQCYTCLSSAETKWARTWRLTVGSRLPQARLRAIVLAGQPDSFGGREELGTVSLARGIDAERIHVASPCGLQCRACAVVCGGKAITTTTT